MTPLSRHGLKSLYPGVALAVVIGAAAKFLSEHYGAPVMLLALLIGMAFNFLHSESTCADGVEFASKALLRLGVGLMGLRLGFEQIEKVEPTGILAVVVMVVLTLGCGVVLSLLLGRRLAFGLLAGGSVAICGASAALAISSVLPPKEGREKDVLFVVVGVTMLSTIAMVLYPILFQTMGMTDQQSGFLIGATIHDVAQVVGAGYLISDESGLIATFVKMLRVAMLPVVMLVVMATFRGAQSQRVGLPWFLVLFVALALVTNLVAVPQQITDFLVTVSGWLLIIAISALGVKTNLGSIVRVGPTYAIILVAETLFLLGIAISYVKVFG